MPTNKNFLDWEGLQNYDALVKEYTEGLIKNSKITLKLNNTEIGSFNLNQNTDSSINILTLTENEIKNIIKYGRANISGLTPEELANLEKYGQTDVDGLTDSEKEALERDKLAKLGLHKVASSGSYNDLKDKPTILDSAAINTLIDNRISGGDSDTTVLTDQNYTNYVKNGSLIIKRNNTTFKDNENHDIIYTANQDGTTIINIPVPEKITDLTNYLDLIQNIIKYGIADTAGKTSEQLENLEKYGREDITGLTEELLAALEAAKLAKLNLAKVAISGSYNDLEDTPTVYTLELIQNIIRYGRADITGLTELQLENLEKYGSTEAPTTDEEKEQAEQAQLDKLGLHKVAKSGDYADLINTPSYSVNYDSTTKKIQLKNGNNVVSEFDASEFIIDGMVDDVRIENSNLIIDFNTDSGKQDISIPISNIFNASNYYNKTDVDNLLNYGTTTPTAEAGTDPVVHESDLEDFLTTETDPVFSASAASGITAQNISDWNGKISGIKVGDTTIQPVNGVVTIPESDNNVQADWNQTDTSAKDYIKNKPTSLPASDVSAWAKAASKPTYTWDEISSKPSTFTPSAHNQASNTITTMTGYSKASSGSSITTSDSLNVAIGKLEAYVDDLNSQSETVAAALVDLNTNKADKSTTLSGYGITDAYTKTEIDTIITDNELVVSSALNDLNTAITPLTAHTADTSIHVTQALLDRIVYLENKVIYNGHAYVDLGLPSGTKWATMNVGATSETDYGNYYQYGKGAAQYAATSGDSNYRGTGDPLDSSVDTASQVWGGPWHMPTREQMQELTANTTYQWVTNYKGSGINGGTFTATNGAVLFIPAAGLWVDGSQYNVGDGGDYWGSSPNGSNGAYYLYLYNGSKDVGDSTRRYGYSVRPVVG